MFFGIAASLGLKCYGGDAQDAYAHSPAPAVPTFVRIDDAYANWYEKRFGHPIDRSLVLPVQHALQGHPESGRLWEEHINRVLSSMGFASTVHDRCIYTASIQNETVYLLRQVDDFSLACTNEALAKAIYREIGQKLILPGETDPPFKYLGLIREFNGVDVTQTRDRIILHCESYIDRILQSHGWTTPNHRELLATPKEPLSPSCLEELYQSTGPQEGSPAALQLAHQQGFSYRTLLGELLYAYTTCRPDIGYAIVTLSKFSTCPAPIHYVRLKQVAKYLRATKSWGIHFWRPSPSPDLPPTPSKLAVQVTVDESLPSFPSATDPLRLTAYVDAAHANDLRNRRSTTGYAITLAGGAVAYRCKTQSVTATSSTEAEFIAAVSAAKTTLYLRSILHQLGLGSAEPTILYEDNASAINIINHSVPTERSRHIDIQKFAIQGWVQDQKSLILSHIPGVINPADSLTKPLGWVLHSRHIHRLMGHIPPSFVPTRPPK